MATHLLFIGGEDHYMRLPFMLALREKGYRVTAAASGDPAPFRAAGIEYHHFHFSRFVDIRADWQAIHTLSSLLREVDADIAHGFDTKLGLLVPFAARTNCRTRIIRTINGRGWLYSSNSPDALALRTIYCSLHRLAAASTAATIFQHRDDQEFFERHRLVGKGCSIVIPGSGIDIEGFEAARARGPSPDQLRHELDLVGAEVVLAVTRVTKQKGIPTLLKAAALVHEARPSARFLLVGPRDSEGSFGVPDAEIDRHAPYVIATGARPDVPSLLAMADVFVFPSEYAEGIPRALMEAALSGLPIVATEIAGCREVIREGWNGYLVPKHNPRALAGRILDLLANRKSAMRMGAEGPALIRAIFSLREIVARHIELYERQLARPKQNVPALQAEISIIPFNEERNPGHSEMTNYRLN